MTDVELRKVVTDYLPETVLRRKGQLLYSGIDTLCPGDFYFVGFNPAADGTNPILQEIHSDQRQWSAYKHQCWFHPHCNETCPKAGQSVHQKRVQSIMSDLRLVPEKTFATNLIFVESRNVAEIKMEIRTGGLFECCWQVHEKLLAIVKPKYIVCLGNGESESAFSLVKSKAKRVANASPDIKAGARKGDFAFKRIERTFVLTDGSDLTARVVGVPHPSRWKCPDGLNEFLLQSLNNGMPN